MDSGIYVIKQRVAAKSQHDIGQGKDWWCSHAAPIGYAHCAVKGSALGSIQE
jgi:hypothetical protein